MVVESVSRLSSALVDIDALVPNPWNPNKMDERMFRKELASIRKFGYINPIICRPVGSTYQIIDGEHRQKALRQLGHSGRIQVTVIEGLSDADAKQLTVVLNETRGHADPARLGSLLKDLLDTETKADLLDILPFSPPVFDKLAGLDDFDWQGVTENATKGSTWVERTYRMPREAAETLDNALAKVTESEGDIPDWQALEFIAADFLA